MTKGDARMGPSGLLHNWKKGIQLKTTIEWRLMKYWPVHTRWSKEIENIRIFWILGNNSDGDTIFPCYWIDWMPSELWKWVVRVTWYPEQGFLIRTSLGYPIMKLAIEYLEILKLDEGINRCFHWLFMSQFRWIQMTQLEWIQLIKIWHFAWFWDLLKFETTLLYLLFCRM